jgi:AmmeMemoRadiSam system protein A
MGPLPFLRKNTMPIDPLGRALLIIARNAICKQLGQEARTIMPHPALAQPAATFVTLMKNHQLRGCIGSLEAYRPLSTDVAENAYAAAFRDSRFAPLNENELAQTRIEVSLLRPAEALEFIDESDAIRQLCPGIDGLILTHGTRRATFLPQVWESLPDPQQFMEQLKLKAGLTANYWDEKITLARYGVQKWKET